MAHREKVFNKDGKQIYSVTQILSIIRKPFLELWRGKLGNVECDRVMHESIDIGHALHDAIEGYFRGDTAQDMREDVAAMFSVFKGWAMDSKFTPLELEMAVTSETYGYQGTLDAVGHFDDGRLLVVDWKTSSSISNDYALQLCAYAQAYKEQTGTEITEGLIVRLDKNKKGKAKKLIEVKRFENLPEYFPVFLAAKSLFEFVNNKA